jgi:hypothetical protein
VVPALVAGQVPDVVLKTGRPTARPQAEMAATIASAIPVIALLQCDAIGCSWPGPPGWRQAKPAGFQPGRLNIEQPPSASADE